MLNLKKQDDDIVKSLKYLKDSECPNFFICGKSVSAMEKLAMRMVQKLEEQEALKFKGMCKHFTIIMPYFDSENGMFSFWGHLLNSISIARDCYDAYCGFVLIEMSDKWGDEGPNDYLGMIFEHIRDQDSMRFLMLCPEGKNSKQMDCLFAEFASYLPCLKVYSATPTVHQCLSIFNEQAKQKGFLVSEDANLYLRQKLKERDEKKTENIDALNTLIKQICFEKEFNRNNDKTIEVEEIQMYFLEKQKKNRVPIGFATRDLD